MTAVPHRERLIYQLTTRITIRVIAAYSIGLAADMALSGPARFGVAALATARLIPGSVYTWAAFIAAGATLTLTGSIRWRRPIVMAGLMWMGLLYGFFDIALWTARTQEPTAPVTGCWIYLMLATVCAVLYVGGHQLDALAKQGTPP